MPPRRSEASVLRAIERAGPLPSDEQIREEVRTGLRDGLLEIVGTDEDGIPLFRLTEAGMREAERIIDRLNAEDN